MPGNTSSPALIIISAMITPALLILGSASLVATALQRLARAVDRARNLTTARRGSAEAWMDAGAVESLA